MGEDGEARGGDYLTEYFGWLGSMVRVEEVKVVGCVRFLYCLRELHCVYDTPVNIPFFIFAGSLDLLFDSYRDCHGWYVVVVSRFVIPCHVTSHHVNIHRVNVCHYPV